MKLVEFSFKREMGWILIFSLGPAVGAICRCSYLYGNTLSSFPLIAKSQIANRQ